MVIQKFNRLIKNKLVWGAFAVLISFFFACDFLFDRRGSDDSDSKLEGAGRLGGQTLHQHTFAAIERDVIGPGRERSHDVPDAVVKRQVWERAAALATAKELGVEVTDAELREQIIHDRGFQGPNGRFSQQAYNQILQRMRMTSEGFQAFLRRALEMERITAVVRDAAWVSPMEAARALNDATDNLTVKIVSFNDTEAGKVVADDKVLQDYYAANTNALALPDLVTVKYVRIPVDTPAHLAKFKIPEDELKDRYDENQSRFETKGTNGVAVVKPFETVRAALEHELQVEASVAAASTAYLARIYPEGVAVETLSNRLEKVAAEEKAAVKVSQPFSPADAGFVKGFMVRTRQVAPDCEGFGEAVMGIEPEDPELRYRVVAGTNCVYLVEIAKSIPAHVPTFAEAKEHIRADALKDAQNKAFKARVEKARALMAADLAKNKPLDVKPYGATVSTSIVFSVNGLRSNYAGNSFADAMYVAMPAAKLEKGQISDFITTPNPRRALLVYMENRQPGDAVTIQSLRADFTRADYRQTMAVVSAWNSWNLERLGYEAASWADFKETAASAAEDDDLDDAAEAKPAEAKDKTANAAGNPAN